MLDLVHRTHATDADQPQHSITSACDDLAVLEFAKFVQLAASVARVGPTACGLEHIGQTGWRRARRWLRKRGHAGLSAHISLELRAQSARGSIRSSLNYA